MSKRSIVASLVVVLIVVVIATALFFHGHSLWNALLVMHGRRPH